MRAKRKSRLERGEIAAKALELIDRDGLEALSMRKLGSALGVEAMALYYHFQNKAELLDGVLELLVGEIEKPAPGSLPPLKRLRRIFENLRQIAIDHPHAFILFPTRRFRTRTSLEFYERLLQTFCDAGFDAEASARYFRVLAGFVTGAGLAEIGSRALQPDATRVILEDFDDRIEFPRVSEVVPYLKVQKLGGVFKFGLDLIFKAMEEDLKKAKGKR